nr:hypothetical protein [Tanacetum cinerariifolium]
MRTHSSSNLIVESFTILERRNRRRSKQIVEPELRTIIETPVAAMMDTRTMSELLQAPTDGYGDAIVILVILAEDFELKVGLLQLVTSSQYHGFKRDDPHAHIRWFNKITSMLKYKNVPHDAIKLMLFPFFLRGQLRLGLKKNPIKFDEMLSEAWDRFKDLGLKLPLGLKKNPIALTIIENKSKVRTSRNKPVVSKVNTTTSSTSPSLDFTALTEIVKELLLNFKATQQATMKAIEETCVIYGGPHPYYECLSADGDTFVTCVVVGSYNQGGASINLMPLSVWKKLSLPDLTPTRMTLELATRSFAYSDGIAEDVFMQVGKFTFSADFIVNDYVVDPRIPLILGRPFLRKVRALVDVYREELILRDDDEKLIFHADSTSKHPHNHGNESINMISFIDITCGDHFPIVLKVKKSNHPLSDSTTPPTPLSDSSLSLTPFETSDSLLEEFADELALFDPFPPGNEDDNFDFRADLRRIKYVLNQDPSIESNTETI